MASLITTPLTYSNEDAMRYFLQPLFLEEKSFIQLYDVLTNVSGPLKLQKFSADEKMTKAEAAGFNAVSGSVMTQRSVIPYRCEAEKAQKGGIFYATVMQEVLKRGLEKDNIDGTIIAEIVAEIFMRGIQADLFRQFWFGDTGSGDADYNLYDGLFKQYENLPAPQKITGPVGALVADAGEDMMQACIDAAPLELRAEMANAIFEISGSVADNYRETLRSGGTEQAYARRESGLPEILNYDGVPVYVRRDWGKRIVNDGLATDTHRVVLHVPKNVAVGTDLDAVSGMEAWYNRDEKENRMRYEYIMGLNYKNDEYAVTNISA